MIKNFIINFCLTVVLFFLVVATQAQVQTLQGRVTNEAGAPVEGASVTVKGSSQGIATSQAGDFAIRVSPNQVIVFSATGYLTKEIKYTDQKRLDVILSLSQQDLEQVVVVG